MIYQQALKPVLFSLNVPSHKGPPWHVLEVEIHEQLSGDYRAILQIESDDPLSDPMALLGAQAVLHMEREGLMAAPRDWAGVIRSVEESFAPDAGGRHYARVQIEPALACLKEEVQTRKFQEVTVPQIVRDVLGAVTADLNRPVRSHLMREHEPPNSGLAYAVRDLCIQYGESTYDFLRRIMAEDGIAHFFDSDSEHESVVLVDDNSSFVEHDRVVRLVPVAGMVVHEESISSFQLRQARAPKQSLVRAFDPTRHLPIQATHARADGELPAGAGEALTYDPGTAVTLFGTKDEAYAHSDAEAQVRLRLERGIAASVEGRGKSDVLAFRPGLLFKMTSDFDAGELGGGRFLITAVHHRGRNPERHTGQGGATKPATYSNEFVCMPSSIPFRPALVPKPRAIEDWGLVVSPSAGDPIFTDRHGRVRVRFGFDRGEEVSTWLPVVQAWAGSDYGVQIIPRAGMLVRIRFLFGDPDRPFVAGCLPTARNVLPTPLPDDKSRLTIRTRSLRNGGNDLQHYNEISLEDAAGQEEVFIRAGRDYRREVLHDEKVDIVHDERRTVGHDQKVEVRGHRRVSVHKDETIAVKQGRKVEIVGDDHRKVHGKEALTVDREMELTVHGPRTTTVVGLETQTLHAGRVEEVTGNDELKVSETLSIVADKEFRVTQGPSTLSMKEGDVKLRAGGTVTIQVDGATVLMKPGGEAVIQCDKRIELACGESSILVSPDKIEIASPEVQLTGTNGAVTLDRSGATTTGLNVSSTAMAKNELTGAFVKAN